VSALVLFSLLPLASVQARAQSASALFKQGQAAESSEDFDTAYQDFQKAWTMAPKDIRYRTAMDRVKVSASTAHVTKGRKLLASGDEQGALVELLRAAEIDPGNEAAQQEIAQIRARHAEAATAANGDNTGIPESAGNVDSMAAPTELKPLSSEPLSLHMVEDSKTIYQAVGKAAGINVLFDPDYTGKRIQVDLNNVSLMDALRIVGTLSGTFWRPVTSNTIFVAQNTRAKRTELEEQAVQTFYLTNAWQQNDLNDVQTALRNVLPNAKVYGVASQNAIVMRATPDELLLAEKLISDLDKARPEVVVDISVLEVAKNWEQNLGISWPQSAGVTLQPPTSTTSTTSTTTTGTTSTSPTLYNLAHLNSTDFAVTLGTATANMLLTDSNTRILQNPRIRCTDAQKATMKIGSRIPIATGSFSSGVGVAAAITPMAETQFQYIDVGVNIEMTPTVHYDHDVTLKLKIEVSSESGSTTISGVTEPIIAQKTSEQTIRLREGEASILGGILNEQDQQNWTGIPGLSSIPILKYLFGSMDHLKTDDEIVFLLVPHIVRSPYLTPVNLRSIDTGAGQNIELRHVSQGVSGAAAAAPQASAAGANAALGTVPGQTAQAAGNAALAQLRAAAEPQPGSTGAPPPSAAVTQASPAASPAPSQAEVLRFAFAPPRMPVAVGATFQVPIVISGAANIASTPMQVQYDASKLTLVNVDSGDFLSRDGQAVALVHRDDGPGTLTINASRPPGAKGIDGAGVVCVLSFQAKTPGESAITITRPGAMNGGGQVVQAQGGQATIVAK
jgi:general secretion pathway protein D